MESVADGDQTKEVEKQKGNMKKSAVENEVNHENDDNLISMGTLMSGNNMKDRENLDKSISMGFVQDVDDGVQVNKTSHELGDNLIPRKLVPDGERQK